MLNIMFLEVVTVIALLEVQTHLVHPLAQIRQITFRNINQYHHKL